MAENLKKNLTYFWLEINLKKLKQKIKILIQVFGQYHCAHTYNPWKDWVQTESLFNLLTDDGRMMDKQQTDNGQMTDSLASDRGLGIRSVYVSSGTQKMTFYLC